MHWWLRHVCTGMVIVLVGLIFGMPQVVQAASDEYPYADMRCVHAPFAPSGSKAGWCPDYDWGLRPGDESRSSVISPYGYYYRNCTDYAAWWLAAHGVSGDVYKSLGDAKNWPRGAAAKGLRVDGAPVVGAVGVRTTGTYGHIAVVEAVDVPGRAPGTIRVSEYNRQATGVYGERTGTPAQLGLTSFIHFGVAVAPAAPQPTPTPLVVPAVTVPETPVPVAPNDAVKQEERALPAEVLEKTVDEPSVPVGEVAAAAETPAADEAVDEAVPEAEQELAAFSTLMSVRVAHPEDNPAASNGFDEGVQMQPAIEHTAALVEGEQLDVLVSHRDEHLVAKEEAARDTVGSAIQAIAPPVYVMPAVSMPVRWWEPPQGSPPVLGQPERLVADGVVPAGDTMMALVGLSGVVLLGAFGRATLWQWWLARRHLPATYRHLGAG